MKYQPSLVYGILGNFSWDIETTNWDFYLDSDGDFLIFFDGSYLFTNLPFGSLQNLQLGQVVSYGPVHKKVAYCESGLQPIFGVLANSLQEEPSTMSKEDYLRSWMEMHPDAVKQDED